MVPCFNLFLSSLLCFSEDDDESSYWGIQGFRLIGLSQHYITAVSDCFWGKRRELIQRTLFESDYSSPSFDISKRSKKNSTTKAQIPNYSISPSFIPYLLGILKQHFTLFSLSFSIFPSPTLHQMPHVFASLRYFRNGYNDLIYGNS